MANSEISTKSEVTDWVTVATYVATFPSDDGEGACDMEVQIGCAPLGERWYIRTVDDTGGGSDEAEDDEYVSEESATVFAEEFAAERDDGDGTENAEEYLDRKTRERAGEPSATGEYCVYWDTSLDDSGPRERYETAEQAEAAANLANDDLRASNPGGNLLCGFGVRQLVDGEWVQKVRS